MVAFQVFDAISKTMSGLQLLQENGLICSDQASEVSQLFSFDGLVSALPFVELAQRSFARGHQDSCHEAAARVLRLPWK